VEAEVTGQSFATYARRSVTRAMRGGLLKAKVAFGATLS